MRIQLRFCVLLCLLLLLPSSPLSANEAPTASELIEKGNDLFSKGEFQEARRAYESARDLGATSADLFYNLGNAYYRTAAYGHAIASYRRSLLRSPAASDTHWNLELARRETKDRLEVQSQEHSGFEELSQKLFTLLSRDQLAVLFLLSYIAFWSCLPLSLKYSTPLLKGIRLPLFLMSFTLFVLALCSRYDRLGRYQLSFSSTERNKIGAVVLDEQVKLYAGDAKTYQVVFVLHEGAEIEVSEERGDWLEVQLPGGRRGWAERANLALIN